MPLGHLLSRAIARTIAPSDDALASVVRALRSRAPGEDTWAERIEAVRARHERADTRRPRTWGRFLYRLVRELDPDCCVTMGAGPSASYVAAGLTANYHGRLVAIDSAESAIFGETAVDERVTLRNGEVRDELHAALDELGPVDLALVDGRRRHEPAVQDFTTLAEATAPGGLLIFDPVDDLTATWRAIRADQRVSGSMTVGSIGFVVVRGVRTRHWRVPRLTVAE